MNSFLAPARASRAMPCNARNGIVYLVGAGPGDPDLLTLKAARLLKRADVVVYDNLVGPGVLRLIHDGAQRIYVGKETNRHTLPQAEINSLLVALATSGKTVIRLKGGDPFVFGRGGEELEALADASIAFEVVPGITAASGIACYAGIPLTHRDHAQSCLFTTGHLKNGSLDLDWQALARKRQTVVIYMGLSSLKEIFCRLTEHGMPADTPAAVVENGTTSQQRVVAGTLETLPDRVRAAGLESPCLIIVGRVVALGERLHWFGKTCRAQAPSPPANNIQACA